MHTNEQYRRCEFMHPARESDVSYSSHSQKKHYTKNGHQPESIMRPIAQEYRIYEKLFISSLPLICTKLLALCLLVSCNQEALKKEDEQLSIQIEELEKQIETFKVLAANQPDTGTATLAGVLEHIDQAKQERDFLSKEKERFDSERSKLEVEHAEYKEKYPLEK